MGGMSPMNILRCATIFGAEGIGLQNDIGSLEPGKLADLIILDANPLARLLVQQSSARQPRAAAPFSRDGSRRR